MASREFTSPDGVQWTVWSVTPQDMSVALKRLTGSGEDRRTPWLAFQSSTGSKRRLTPVPPDWESSDDAALIALWDGAALVPPAPGRRSKDVAPPEPDV